MRVASKLAVVAALITTGATAAMAQDLTGAGATFPYPIYSKWFSDYAAKAGRIVHLFDGGIVEDRRT